MPALTKRQVEVLVNSIDTDELFHQVVIALRWMFDASTRDVATSELLLDAARRLHWTDKQLEALAGRDPFVLAELAAQLAERRSFA